MGSGAFQRDPFWQCPALVSSTDKISTLPETLEGKYNYISIRRLNEFENLASKTAFELLTLYTKGAFRRTKNTSKIKICPKFEGGNGVII